VKDCFGGIRPRHDYFTHYSRFAERFETEKMSIECARKFVEGAVDFAAEAQIEPHPDYRSLAGIFGDADSASMLPRLYYGKDGKPFFMPGPYDSPFRSSEIMQKLTKRYGADGVDYLAQITDPDEEGEFFPSEADEDLLEGPESYTARSSDDEDDGEETARP
jgi:hypothetical protein